MKFIYKIILSLMCKFYWRKLNKAGWDELVHCNDTVNKIQVWLEKKVNK